MHGTVRSGCMDLPAELCSHQALPCDVIRVIVWGECGTCSFQNVGQWVHVKTGQSFATDLAMIPRGRGYFLYLKYKTFIFPPAACCPNLDRCSFTKCSLFFFTPPCVWCNMSVQQWAKMLLTPVVQKSVVYVYHHPDLLQCVEQKVTIHYTCTESTLREEWWKTF